MINSRLFTCLMLIVCSIFTFDGYAEIPSKITPTPLTDVKLIKDQTPFSLEKRPTVLCYGEHWCSFCKKALPALDALSERYKELQIYYVTPAEHGRYTVVTNTFFHLATIGDEGAILRSLASVTVYPTFLFLDDQGRLVAKKSGSVNWDEEGMVLFLGKFIDNKGKLDPESYIDIIINKVTRLFKGKT